jgi:acyl-CoA thioester hydrolase
LGFPGSGKRVPLVLPDDRDVHTTSVKVRFYELDPYDHVNHTNYFGYFETARVEFLTEMGWGLDVLKKQGLQFVVVEARARFLSAATYGQELTIHTWVEEVGRVKSTWQQRMVTDDTEVARLAVSFAATDLNGKPRRMPEEFVALF